MAQFAVFGLGSFGATLSIELHQLGHEVLVFERDPDRAQAFRDDLPNIVVADGTDRAILEEFGVGAIPCAVISLGEALEASVLITLHCRELGVETIYTKAMSDIGGRILSRVGASQVIYPERAAAKRLVHRLTSPNLLDYLPIGEGHSVEQVYTPKSLVGRSLGELRVRERFGVQVLAVKDSRTSPDTVRMADADSVLLETDQLILLGPNKKLAEFDKL